MKILLPYLARWKTVNWTRYHSLLSQVAAMGHEVHVIQTPPLRSEETNFQEIPVDVGEGIHLVEAKLNPRIWGAKVPLEKLFKKGYYAAMIGGEVRRLVRELGIDVLLLYNLPHYPLLGVEGCLKVFDYADDYVDMLDHELGRVSNRYALAIGKLMLDDMVRRCEVTTCISNVLAERLGGDVVVLPNGVDLTKALRGDGRGLKQDLPGPVVGFIGSFEYFVDFDIILESARCLPEATFLLVGGGREWRKVNNETRRLGLRNVIMPGGVPHGRVFDYIDAMDICLNVFRKIPVSHSACPLKLFEYFSMGKPVISTTLDEVKRIDNGAVFFADTPDEVTSIVRTLLSDGNAAADAAKRGKQMVQEVYNWEVLARQFLELLEGVLANG
jgi:glycosyltransferase involved in cell wall biosynthesis